MIHGLYYNGDYRIGGRRGIAPASGKSARRKVPPDEEPPIDEQMETVYCSKKC